MIEDLLIELIQPIKAINLLTIFLEEQILNEVIYDINKNQRIKNQNTLAINYVINLVNKDIFKLRKKYYKKMNKENMVNKK